MLQPETNLSGRSEQENLKMLVKTFRRYSRCEDAFLPPLLHAEAIKKRIATIFCRRSGNVELSRQISYRAWPTAELLRQLKNPDSENPGFNIGLADTKIVHQAFMIAREEIKPRAMQELELRRA